MFSDKKEKSSSPAPSSGQNRIDEGTTLKGEIHSNGFFRIDGTVEGNVNTPSKVVIGKTGVIIGTLTCENADVEGKIEGNINVSETLSLRATANIDGDVTVGKLAVEPGASLNASCSMQISGGKSGSNKKSTQKENPSDRSFEGTQPLKKVSDEK